MPVETDPICFHPAFADEMRGPARLGRRRQRSVSSKYRKNVSSKMPTVRTTSSRIIMLAPASQSTGPVAFGTPMATARPANRREIGPVRAAPSNSDATEVKRKQVGAARPGPWK